MKRHCAVEGARLIAIAICAIAMTGSCALGQTARRPSSTPQERQALFAAAARLYDLDPALLKAIAAVESDGNPLAVSPKGAQGLMQLMPSTARRFAVADPFDPIDNLLGAVRFIAFLKHWQAAHPELGGLAELLAAYNAGAGAVEKYHGVPPYPETQEYVRRVMLAYFLGAEPGRELHKDNRRRLDHARHITGQGGAGAETKALDPLKQLAAIRRERVAAQKREQQSAAISGGGDASRE